MNGVVLFADNKVFSRGNENELLTIFLQKKEFSVIPVDSLTCLEDTIKSLSTIKACIIDWNFDNSNNADEDFDWVALPQRTPLSILINNPLYSLVYIYSEKSISDGEKKELKKKFGRKIRFRNKGRDVAKEYLSISKDIRNFEKDNPHMSIPFIWSQTINSSTQSLFEELEKADPNWVKEFRENASIDGGDPTTELISVFNNVLFESIIQSSKLRQELDNYNATTSAASPKSIAKVYQKLLYSKVPQEAPLTTGELFKFKRGQYGILITPECEINERKDHHLDFLLIERRGFNEYLVKNNSYNQDVDEYYDFKEKRKENLRKIFNNDCLSVQVLPVYPFTEKYFNEVACINFKTAYCIKKKNEYENKRFGYKLNSPYIYQLRQRYMSFFGKYGTPAIPITLRDYNLQGRKKLQ